MFGLHQKNLVPDADWHELKWIIQNIGRRQSIRASWNIFKDSYEKPFQEFIDEQFSIADGATEQE
jgi:hypothetical protein